MTPPEARTVVDTNVLISAAFSSDNTPRRALVHAARRGALLFSAATLYEFESRLARPKLAKYISASNRHAYTDWVRARGTLIEAPARVAACRDPDDDKFLNVALAGRAEAIVSGDSDLLALHPFRGIPILAPAAYLGTFA